MKKNLIIRNKSDIDILFGKEVKSFSDGILMFRVVSSDSTKFLFAVSSKKFKRAVDRNRIKRFMKESVRDSNVIKKNIAMIYIGNEIPTLEMIKNSVNRFINS